MKLNYGLKSQKKDSVRTDLGAVDKRRHVKNEMLTRRYASIRLTTNVSSSHLILEGPRIIKTGLNLENSSPTFFKNL